MVIRRWAIPPSESRIRLSRRIGEGLVEMRKQLVVYD
jgi:hypothetical protein